MITPAGRVKVEGYTTDIITDLSIDWLKTKRDPSKPFLLLTWHKAPHRNWQPGPKQLNLYDDVMIPEPPTLFDDYKGRGTAAKTQDMTIAQTLTPNDLKLDGPPKGLNAEQERLWHEAYDAENRAFEKAGLKGDDLVRWKYQRYMKDYLRCVASVDENVGRLLDYLDESGLSENTIVVYTSDQGFYLGEHGWFDKRWIYEESLHTPLLVRWPGVTPAGRVCESLVSNIDLAPTFLEAAGVKVPAEMQGRSLLPLLKGETPGDWRSSFYYNYYEFPAVHSVRRHEGVRTDRYTLVHFYDLDEWELYDLKDDPNQLHSVYDDPGYAEVVKRLKDELVRLREQNKVPAEPPPLRKPR
jgi:arylsulfatase A-like enzyme